jgi:type IV pilus assembly protein PilN
MHLTEPTTALVRINFLPHREQRQQQTRTRFQRLLVAVLAAGTVLPLSLLADLNMQHERQRQRTRFLQQAHEILDRQITQTDLLKKELQYLSEQEKLFGQLQQQRNEAVLLLTQLVQLVPKRIHLRALKQESRHLSLHGHAASAQDITILLQQLRQADTLENAQLRHTTQTGDQHEFIVTAVMASVPP